MSAEHCHHVLRKFWRPVRVEINNFLFWLTHVMLSTLAFHASIIVKWYRFLMWVVEILRVSTGTSRNVCLRSYCLDWDIIFTQLLFCRFPILHLWIRRRYQKFFVGSGKMNSCTWRYAWKFLWSDSLTHSFHVISFVKKYHLCCLVSTLMDNAWCQKVSAVGSLYLSGCKFSQSMEVSCIFTPTLNHNQRFLSFAYIL